jgi:hypothetical protein
VRNEIGMMEDRIENVIGQQLHLEIKGQGVYDYVAVKLFLWQEAYYLLLTRLSPLQEGYLMRIDDLGDGWFTVQDIADDAEWEQAKSASGWEEYSPLVHR